MPTVRLLTQRASWVLMVVAFLAGCTTAWQDSGLFHRTVQTTLAVESSPPAAHVFLNNKYLGDTPLSTVLDCEQELKTKTRKVSYWVTQPGLSLLLSITSLGLYVPFSVIPADPETSQEPTGAFRNNEFVIRVEVDGHSPWRGKVVCGTQPGVSVRAVLEKL